MPIAADEAVLLTLARAGDSTAFADLVAGYRDPVWAICLRLTGNHADAEDAMQDALLAAWQHLDGFRADSRFGTWLYRIATNAALGLLRKRRAVPVDPADLELPGLVTDHAERVAETDRVQRAFEQLPEPFRAALVLREYGGLSYEQIAEHLGVGVQTVKSRLHRARVDMVRLLS
ncbi:RNA polymerase sigma factor [Actinokineospora sp. HUAS TT18]|uniref:RNA polymerase sigma factor n=1 Tax=Actinokineospora sp. HUAS TT18 TaxID=3447451 RepID=UPI003F523ECB